MENTVLVIKRNGEKEPFDKNKIVRVTQAAGLNEKEALELGGSVEQFVQGKREVSTSDIRDYVLDILKKNNSYAAGLYGWYEKTKDGKIEDGAFQ